MNKFSHKGSEKKKLVTRLFNDIARRYDFLNHFFSFGIDYYWRNRLVKSIQPQKNHIVLGVEALRGKTVNCRLIIGREERGIVKWL